METQLSYERPEKIKAFADWLVSQGAEILPATNEYEMLRFKDGDRIGIIWTSKKSYPRSSKACGTARNAWACWKSGNPLPLSRRRKTTRKTKSEQVVDAILERDGATCWYCDHPFSEHLKPTLEHLVPVSHGGPNHLSNLALACSHCNAEAGHMSVSEKVNLKLSKQQPESLAVYGGK